MTLEQNPPVGLEGFEVYQDLRGFLWWKRSEDGWEYFARKVDPSASESPSYSFTKVENFGVLPDSEDDQGEVMNFGLEVTPDDMEDQGILHTYDTDLGAYLMGVESTQQLPFNLPEPKVTFEFGEFILPALTLTVGLLLSAVVFRFRRESR